MRVVREIGELGTRVPRQQWIRVGGILALPLWKRALRSAAQLCLSESSSAVSWRQALTHCDEVLVHASAPKTRTHASIPTAA